MNNYLFGLLLIICLNSFGQKTSEYKRVFFTKDEKPADKTNAYYKGRLFSLENGKDSVVLYKFSTLKKIKVYPNGISTNHYFDYEYKTTQEGLKLTSKAEYNYIESEQKKLRYCEEYDDLGRLKSKKSYENKLKTGSWIECYENGKIKEEGTYYQDKKDGIWTYHDIKGFPKVQIEHNKNIEEEALREFGFREKIIGFWNKQGEQLINNGTGDYYSYYENGTIEVTGKYKDYHPVGKWNGYNRDGSLYYEETYDDSGKLLEGKSYYEGEIYKYDSATNQIKADFPGGLEAFYSYVNKNLRYPAGAKSRGLVVLSYVVEKDGTVTNIEVFLSPEHIFDAEAIRLLKNSPKWTPGIIKGRNIREKKIIPISFRLE